MSCTAQQILDAITELYTSLEDNFDTIYAQCETPAQKSAFRNRYLAARDTYWKSVNESLKDANATVEQFVTDLNATNTQIKDALTAIKDVDSFIKLLTQAVQLAASLATLASAT